MKSEYDIKNMRRVAHPLQDKINRGEWKLVDHMDISDEQFEKNIAALDADDRDFAIKTRDLWKKKQAKETPVLNIVKERVPSRKLPPDVLRAIELVDSYLAQSSISAH